MKTKLTYLIAAALLIFMSCIAYHSMKDDSAIMDEVAHLPAGYSYITQGDMRLNAEHPPLIKDLAGLAVLAWAKITGAQISFPYEIKAWNENINGQWDFGFNFLYDRGNRADAMLFAGRLPMLLILMALGIYLFKWTRELWGKKAALLALFLFAFSPTFLAHGRFVTTDVAAAAAFFISTYYFFRWLKAPEKINLIVAGVFFGLAQIAKFSLFLIVPYFVALAAGWIIVNIVKSRINFSNGIRLAWHYAWGLALIFLIGYVFIVTPLYIFHVKNYPLQKQVSDMRFIMASYGGGPDQQPLESCKSLSRITRCPAELTIAMTKTDILPLRAFGQYLLGLLMVVQRAAGGNTTYFIGEVSASGWGQYFPTVYALKEPLALHILTLAAVIFSIWGLLFRRKTVVFADNSFSSRLAGWLHNNFVSLAMLFFIAFYWFMSVRSPLNIGVRHVLPTFPFIFALVASQITAWTRTGKKGFTVLKNILVGFLLLSQAIAIVAIYPYFLSYFNEIAGGPENGHKYVVDSNLDWGQDLKRLAKWSDENGVNKIYLEYFGGATAPYYLGKKFQPWWGMRDPKDLKSGEWIAVSATLLMGGQGKPARGYASPTGYYDWLKAYEPKTIIGHSIFVFQKP